MMTYITAVAIVPARLTAGILMLHINTMGRVYEALVGRRGVNYKLVFLVCSIPYCPCCACV
jgi:hypothetical protein